jgi:tRNA A64-2'-O-ribosylphosphate transferase
LRYLRRPQTGENRVVVLCESGRDLSVGVALAIYCWCFDDAGNVRSDSDRVTFTKTSIRVRLGHIVTALPEANPSRATLQSVNSFLMDWRK